MSDGSIPFSNFTDDQRRQTIRLLGEQIDKIDHALSPGKLASLDPEYKAQLEADRISDQGFLDAAQAELGSRRQGQED